MIAPLACCLALISFQQDGHLMVQTNLPARANSIVTLYMKELKDPLDPPHMSPKRFGESKIQWEFPWLVAGFANVRGDKPVDVLRFGVYSQEEKGGRGPQVTRMLLRLWEFNVERLHLDNPLNYHRGMIDVFLCFGGQAGGEQLLGDDVEPDPQNPGKTITYRDNTIYIYDMPSFTDPVEMAREIAHEYGHATLPPIGGFKDPEEWADGYLAEKMDLRWISEAIGRGELTPDDVMGATKAGIDKWLAAHADPLILAAAQTLPTEALLANKKAEGMNAFVGLALYIEMLYSDDVFMRSVKMSGFEAKDYLPGVILACEEPKEITLNIPKFMIRKQIWIPLGTGKLTGAPILRTDPSGWVLIQVGANPVVVRNPRQTL